MTSHDEDFNARMKRVRVKLGGQGLPPLRQPGSQRDFDEQGAIARIVLPQLAFVLGAAALIASRAIAMNYLGVDPDTNLLGAVEGGLLLLLLLSIGLLFGKSETLSHGALVVGAALAFLGESYYIAAAPDLMGFIYTPDYVARVILSA
jgi:hypothetical protein